ncbi:MAG: DNA primase [Planctomycetota bacterium]
MSFASTDDTKERVREATDLVDLVSRSVRLRRQGKLYVGLCPWHDDSRPSLQVNPERQSWKCWVCDVGGDVFSFAMKREGVDFPTALRILADRAGIPLTSSRKQATAGSPDDKQTLFGAVAWAEEQFHRCLLDTMEAQPARAYLGERGISEESIERFHLGFAPGRWQWLLDRAKTTPFSPEVLEAAGLVGRSQDGRRQYDRFRGRLMFSIRDTEHRPIAFGGRILPGGEGSGNSPKYINSPETRLFSKSNNLYALDFVRDSLSRDPRIVVVEGYTDVIMAHQHGARNVVAALGTALGERHVRLLQRFAEEVVLVLDGDEAGQRRTNEILELFIGAQVNLKILTLPSELDPCDLIRQHGIEAFRGHLDQAVDALAHKVRTVTTGLDIVADPDRAHHALEEILATMANAPRPSHVARESLRLREQQMLVRLARQFHVEEPSLRARLNALRGRQKGKRGGSQPAAELSPTPAAQTVSFAALSPAERELFQILLTHPELGEPALGMIESEQLVTAAGQQLWQLYRTAGEEQAGFECGNIMTLVEDPALKNTLVQLQDDAYAKAEVALEDAENRLHGLVRNFHFLRERRAERQTLAALQQREYDEKEELEVLQRIIQNERNRQGISAPTDG